MLEDVSKSDVKTMLIIDEIDTLFRNRESHNNDHHANYRTLEAALDTLLRERNDKVVIVGTTNDYDSLPESTKSRFGRNHFEISYPTNQERKKIIQELFEQVAHSDGTLTPSYVDELNNKIGNGWFPWSETNYSARDIHNLIATARMLAFKRRNNVLDHIDSIDLSPVKIGKNDIEQALKVPRSNKRLTNKQLLEGIETGLRWGAHAGMAIQGIKAVSQVGKWAYENKGAIKAAASACSNCCTIQ